MMMMMMMLLVVFIVVAQPLSSDCVASMAVSGPKMMMMIGVWRPLFGSQLSVGSQ